MRLGGFLIRKYYLEEGERVRERWWTRWNVQLRSRERVERKRKEGKKKRLSRRGKK
jgi:hypothetical protein